MCEDVIAASHHAFRSGVYLHLGFLVEGCLPYTMQLPTSILYKVDCSKIEPAGMDKAARIGRRILVQSIMRCSRSARLFAISLNDPPGSASFETLRVLRSHACLILACELIIIDTSHVTYLKNANIRCA